MLAAEAYLFQPYFSKEILDNTVRSLVGREGISQDAAEGIVDELKREYKEALHKTPSKLHRIMANHPSKRHVLATAHSSHSELIVTFHLEHFKQEDLEEWNIRAIHPDDFLCRLCDEVGDRKAYEIVEQLVEDLGDSNLSVLKILDKLYKQQITEFSSRITTYKFTKDIVRVATNTLKEVKVFNGQTYSFQTVRGKLHITTKEGRVLFKSLPKHKTEGRIIPEDVHQFLEFEEKSKGEIKRIKEEQSKNVKEKKKKKKTTTTTTKSKA